MAVPLTRSMRPDWAAPGMRWLVLLVILFGLWTLPGPHQAWLMGH